MLRGLKRIAGVRSTTKKPELRLSLVSNKYDNIVKSSTKLLGG